MLLMMIVLFVMLSVSIFINVNLTRKFEKLDEMAQESVDALLENESNTNV